MTFPDEDEAAARTIERLLDCSTARERSGVLLESLVGSGLCLSAALWRQVGRGEVRAWHPILARGSASLLPTLGQLRGVVAGELPEQLGRGRHVVLPIGHADFALTLATDALGADEEQIGDEAAALFQIWLAVEQAGFDCEPLDLLDALPGLSRRDAHEEHPLALDRSFLGVEDSFSGELHEFLLREAAWLLCPSVELELRLENLPPLAADPIQLEACLRELLANAAAGAAQQSRHIRISIVPAAPETPGVVIVFEDNGGDFFAPSTDGAQAPSDSLFTASSIIHSLGGDFRLDCAPPSGTRITAWLPRRTDSDD